jgi:hypothetical protein
MRRRYLIIVAILVAAVTFFPNLSLAQSGDPSDEPALSPYWPTVVSRWEPVIVRYAQERDLDPDFIAAVIWKESKGNPQARSVVGAVGLMQLMPSEWRPNPKELEDPWTNVSWGARALAQTIRDGNGDVYYSLAAYNGGWNQIHLRVTRRYATEVMDCYTRAIAVRHGLEENGSWLAVFATDGASGPHTITVLGPHRPLVRYTERPGIHTDTPIVPDGPPSHATTITFEDEWGAEVRTLVWLISEDGSPLSP